MDAPLTLWIVRLAWLSLPFLAWAGPSAALTDASAASNVTVAAAAWAVWAAVLVGSALVRPAALVALRLLMPLAPAATAVGLLLAAGDGELAAGDANTIQAVIGFVVGVAATAGIMLPSVGGYFLDGESYGDERRYGLRCPGGLVVALGPLWLLGVGLPATGLALVAAQRWAPGVPALLIGGLAGIWLWAVVIRLARRFVVFVPAGLTLVDPLSLADPVLFARNRTVSVGPATAPDTPTDRTTTGGNDAARIDLSGAALGLAVELITDEPTEVVTLSRPDDRNERNERNERAGTTGADEPSESAGPEGPATEMAARIKQARMLVPRQAGSVLFTPSQPAEFLLHARRAGFPKS